MADSNRLAEELSRDLYVFEDENNPMASQINRVFPKTILDQVFDQLSPTRKNLREIIADLRQEILSGGLGNIQFPVTSVNGMTEDVEISKATIGLGRVDNTRDIDKPLSVPQRNAIMDILSSYDYKINLTDINNHILDLNNPHKVTFEQLNADETITELVNSVVRIHSRDEHQSVHLDIRRNLSKLWILTEHINDTVEDRMSKTLELLEEHLYDKHPHPDVLDKKEDVKNKSFLVTSSDNDHVTYPSTRALVEFVGQALYEFRETLPDVVNWIDSVGVVQNRSGLPPANAASHRRAYFICQGNTAQNEFAVCKKNPDDITYSWEIFVIGSYSTFNPAYFEETEDGMSLKMGSIIDAIIDENGMLDTKLSTILSDYYTADYVNKNFLRAVTILPGTMDGHIRYYINKDMSTMSDDIPIPGLKNLAYQEWITEDNIWPLSVHERHILNRAVTTRTIDTQAVTTQKIACSYGFIIGNADNATTKQAHEISLIELADYLRPLIGGWPDPNTPGGNPWSTVLSEFVPSPHLYTPGIEMNMADKSYIMRFVGTISAIPNYDMKTTLSTTIKLDDCELKEAGGSWVYQSNPKSMTILGGSNITGHTFATVSIDKFGLYFETISIGDRMNAPYDIWVRYTKAGE
jgi:hypothetical protein